MGSSQSLVSHEDIKQKYRIGDVLGRGSFSTARTCTALETNKEYAVKVIDSDNDHVSTWSSFSMFKREVDFLKSLNHPHIVRLIDCYQDKKHLYIVTEKCTGGEVFERLLKKKRFDEQEACQVAIEALMAISYVHKAGIIHRDIKAENFLYGADGRLKLIDFGLAVRIRHENEVLTSVVGSAHYLAPEMIKQQYSKSVDVWSAGVMIYLILYGKYPFDGPNDETVIRKIRKQDVDYKSQYLVSDRAIKFLKALLEKEPSLRLTADQALKHEFLNIPLPSSNKPGMVNDDDRETVAGDNDAPPKVFYKVQHKNVAPVVISPARRPLSPLNNPIK